jgi:gliding motility-associated lipoprotein GldH
MKYCLFLISIICIGFASCGPKKIFSEEHEIENQLWNKNNSISYTFDVRDTIKQYDFWLNVKSNSDFKYQNVYVIIETVFPKGNRTEDQVSLELNKPNGEPHGSCNGDRCETPILLLEKVKFPNLGNYTINIKQYSRMIQIEGLEALKLTVQETQN